jgi:cytidyltransferase-like protein
MGRSIVLASGFFDPPHRGHVAYLQEAKKLGERLVVLIHRDECCVKKKGYCFMPLEDRLAIITAMRFVDEVIVCGEACDLTSCEALQIVKPNIFAKGGDRTPDNMPKSEVELCGKLGIKIVYGVGGEKFQSSSWLLKNFEHRVRRLLSK